MRGGDGITDNDTLYCGVVLCVVVLCGLLRSVLS